MDATLQNHIDLCEKVYSLFLEENSLLKQAGSELEQTVLDRKRSLLAQLEESLGCLRAVHGSASRRTAEQCALIDKAQQLTLKTLLLDRENEQLLLKRTVSKTPSPPPSVSHLQRIYGKHFA